MPLAWGTYKFRNAERQRRAVAIIRSMGGDAEPEYEYDDYEKWLLKVDSGDQYSSPEPPGSSKLRKILGNDLYDGLASHSIAKVRFPRYMTSSYRGRVVAAEVSDDDLPLLGDLPGLRVVELEFQPITDFGIRHLRNVKSLERLDLYGTKITDEALKTIAELPKLEELNVGGTRVTAQALQGMIGKTKIKELLLSSDQIKSAGTADKLESLFPDVNITRYDAREDGGVSFGTP